MYINLSRYNNNCRLVTVKMEHENGRFKPSSMRSALNSIAKDWGSVNTSKTVFNDDGMLLMNFSCSDHGGYVLFSHKLIAGFAPVWSKLDFTLIPADLPDFYIYVFEEDCAWATLILSLKPEHLDLVAEEYNQNRIEQSPTIEAAKERLLKVAHDSVSHWYPSFVAKPLI